MEAKEKTSGTAVRGGNPRPVVIRMREYRAQLEEKWMDGFIWGALFAMIVGIIVGLVVGSYARCV